jgi:DNA-binding winged helix-turn-helix (wHTH) protein/tetratricopeptide (TPR) repeat protein/TolB-like protein
VNAVIPLSPKGLYEFGPFRLDCARHLLLKDSKSLQLPPKAFEILVLLVERRGVLMTKAELLHAVWPDTFVEENNLTQYVSMLRKALGDEAEDQKYIQTVPKLGYRFVSDVREVVEGETAVLVAKHTRTRVVMREEQEEEGEELSVDSKMQGSVDLSVGASERAALSSAERRSVKTWIVAFLALVVAAATAVVFLPRTRTSKNSDHAAGAPPPASAVPPIKPRYSIAVLGFKNLSGRTDEDWLSPALAEMLTTELLTGGQLRIVSGEDVHRMRSDLNLENDESLARPTLEQIRKRVGADLVVSGSYVEVGREPDKQIRLDLRLQDTAAGETVFSTAVHGSTQELFALVSRSGGELRRKLGAPMLSSIEGAQDQAALPSTPEAARLYAEGLSKLRLFDAPAAEKLLTATVATDPNFALGHSALASAWSALGYDEKAKSEGRRALDLSLNLSRQEHLLVAGQYSELTRDWESAVATYQELSNLFPDNIDYGLRLANAFTFAGKGSSALATLEKLRKLPPPAGSEPQIDLARADAAESLGDFKQELEASERAIRNGQLLGERLLVARAWTKKSWALRRLGQPQASADGLLEAKKVFAEAGDVQGVGSTLQQIGGMQSEQGDFAAAARNYQEAIAIFRRIGDRRALAMTINGLAVSDYDHGDLRSAGALYHQYYDIEREVGSKVNTAGALGNMANVEDGLGNLAEARRLNEESVPIFAEVGDRRAMGTALANIAISMYEMGDLEGAQKKLQEALDIKRQIGYQRGIAYDLAALGEIYRAEDNLVAAKQKHEESLAIRHQIGEKHNAAESRLYLATLALEEQRLADAEKIATETAREFEAEKSTADEAAAEVVVARALLAQGKFTEARAALSHATKLAHGASNLPLSFDIAATSARLAVEGTHPPSLSSVAKAERNVESSLAVARKCGYLEYQYKLRLTLGEIEMKTGDVSKGQARLKAVVADANSKGFKLVARQATLAQKFNTSN